jgi:hypothetical protein
MNSACNTSFRHLLVGLPKTADSQRWDILAKVPMTGEGAPNIVNGRPLPPPFNVGVEMLHGLLIDRFGLKTHTEEREITVYAPPDCGERQAEADASRRIRADRSLRFHGFRCISCRPSGKSCRVGSALQAARFVGIRTKCAMQCRMTCDHEPAVADLASSRSTLSRFCKVRKLIPNISAASLRLPCT